MAIRNDMSSGCAVSVHIDQIFEIKTENLGKRFGNQQIFRDANLAFCTGKPVVICGANGSGKSSLLMCLMGYSLPSSGQIIYTYGQQNQSADTIFNHTSLVAPYMELPEEMSLGRLIQFHFAFKKMQPGYNSYQQIAAMMMLESSFDKPVKTFSSGMKQRLKLGLAFGSDTPLLFLDEPCVNLDSQGIDWYQNQIQAQYQNRLLILASNNPQEYTFCDQILDMNNLKKN